MNLNDFLDGLAEETARTEKAHDIREIIARAKQKGLIQTGGDRAALTVAAKRLLGKNLTGLPALAKDAGALAAELAGVQTRWMDVTPAIAELWLKRNFNNRPMRQDTIRAYAREMKNGKWMPNHQGIAFNDRDELQDGQHRLSAVVMSGCTVRMMVTFGMPSKVKGTRMTGMDTVDRGATRSIADQLKIQHKIHGGSVISAICARLAGLCSPERTRRLSVGEVLDIQDLFSTGIEFVTSNRPKTHGLKQAGVLAAFAFAIEAKPEPVMTCWDNLMGDAEMEQDNPIAQLRKFLVSDEAILLRRGNDRALAELTLYVLQAAIAGERMKMLTTSCAGLEYFRALQPERVEKVRTMFELPPVMTKPAKAAA